MWPHVLMYLGGILIQYYGSLFCCSTCSSVARGSSIMLASVPFRYGLILFLSALLSGATRHSRLTFPLYRELSRVQVLCPFCSQSLLITTECTGAKIPTRCCWALWPLVLIRKATPEHSSFWYKYLSPSPHCSVSHLFPTKDWVFPSIF